VILEKFNIFSIEPNGFLLIGSRSLFLLKKNKNKGKKSNIQELKVNSRHFNSEKLAAYRVELTYFLGRNRFACMCIAVFLFYNL